MITPAPYYSLEWVRSITNDVKNGILHITPTFYVELDAKLARFESVVNSNTDVVVFLGHSVTVPEIPEWGSVGLTFHDRSIVRVLDPQPYGPGGEAATKLVTRIETKAKVVSIGACKPGEIFLSLWDIDSTTTDRALIVPVGENTNTGLYDAAGAWFYIARSLGRGETVSASVADANSWLQGLGRTLRFTVIGGRNVRVR